jgi:hypothetical protein
MLWTSSDDNNRHPNKTMIAFCSVVLSSCSQENQTGDDEPPTTTMMMTEFRSSVGSLKQPQQQQASPSLLSAALSTIAEEEEASAVDSISGAPIGDDNTNTRSSNNNAHPVHPVVEKVLMMLHIFFLAALVHHHRRREQGLERTTTAPAISDEKCVKPQVAIAFAVEAARGNQQEDEEPVPDFVSDAPTTSANLSSSDHYVHSSSEAFDHSMMPSCEMHALDCLRSLAVDLTKMVRHLDPELARFDEEQESAAAASQRHSCGVAIHESLDRLNSEPDITDAALVVVDEVASSIRNDNHDAFVIATPTNARVAPILAKKVELSKQENSSTALQTEDNTIAVGAQLLDQSTIFAPEKANISGFDDNNISGSDDNNDTPRLSHQLLETLKQNVLDWEENIVSLKSVQQHLGTTAIRDDHGRRIDQQLLLAVTSYLDANQAYQDALENCTCRPTTTTMMAVLDTRRRKRGSGSN